MFNRLKCFTREKYPQNSFSHLSNPNNLRMHHTERGFIAHIERFLTLEKKMISTPFFSGNRWCEYTTGEGKYVPSKRSQLFATLSSISLSICVLCEWWKTGYSVQTVQHAKKSWGRERESVRGESIRVKTRVTVHVNCPFPKKNSI